MPRRRAHPLRVGHIRPWPLLLALTLALGFAASARAQLGGVQVSIREPAPDAVLPGTRPVALVEGKASVIGGIRTLDLFLVMDSSKSLRKTDPNDHRTAGAIGLVRSLSWSNAHIGVVDFDKKGVLLAPLTRDRAVVIEALRGLDQFGKTDLAAGIRTALAGFAQGGRPGGWRVMLLFTDGRANSRIVREAMAEARAQGVTISTLLLGSDVEGESMLREVAEATGGDFVAVRDPADLPDAFLGLRTTGIERVELRVNGSAPIAARVVGDTFSAEVPLTTGENRIAALALSVDGRKEETAVDVTLRALGCAELEVRAERDGQPTLSLSRRAVQIVVDASGSMWGAMGGSTKIEIAKEILEGALSWLPPDLNLSLRAYGHQYPRQEQNCEDTELLVAPGAGNRDAIRAAIGSLRPKGQTPLGYALEQVPADFDGFVGERAIVLVTDGLESCGGDAAAAAERMQQGGSIPVHVIGFGLDGKTDDLESLRAIARASGGKFLTAGSAAELRSALGTTVGTAFEVWRGDAAVGAGTLGTNERIRLPAGEYRVRLASEPPVEVPVTLRGEEGTTLVLRSEGTSMSHTSSQAPAAYAFCAPPTEAVPANAGSPEPPAD